ncbi:hypothetical protein L211DRAFT_849105 [Terfezia boudieri ATCC MYA-4762]|uniref:Uncharacterized protein n=1 Tax=Terfezia boudieri ATCC MYA-4762 TaxID=1051890 RepID=A0A3N4LS52_9PEZI|nr:hypothetical protein L211DRAFT_849105 [Terfezia boudieri ATCC MYA-4762]
MDSQLSEDAVEYWETLGYSEGASEDEEDKDEGLEDKSHNNSEGEDEEEQQGEAGQGGKKGVTAVELSDERVKQWETMGSLLEDDENEGEEEESDNKVSEELDQKGQNESEQPTQKNTVRDTRFGSNLRTHELLIFATCARRRPFTTTPLTLNAVNAMASILSLFHTLDLGKTSTTVKNKKKKKNTFLNISHDTVGPPSPKQLY